MVGFMDADPAGVKGSFYIVLVGTLCLILNLSKYKKLYHCMETAAIGK